MRSIEHGPRFLPALTSLRFFFAFGVLLFHLKFTLPAYFSGADFDKLKVGVQFFFVLSGFVLGHTYRQQARLDLREFYVKRFARIYPLHLTTFAFWAVFFWAIWEVPLRLKLLSVAANLTLTQAFIPGLVFALGGNAVSWSLSDEFFFYAVFPWVRRLKVAVVVVLVVSGYLAGVSLLHKEGAINAQFPLFDYFFPPVRLADFGAGIVAAHLFRAERKLRWPTLMEIAIVAILSGQLFCLSWPDDFTQAGFLFTTPVFLWIFAHQQGAISRFLGGQAWLVLLGEASFSLYMWHMLLLSMAGRHLPHDWPRMPVLIGTVMSIVGISVLSYLMVEKPCRRFLTTRLLKHRQSAAA